MYVSFCPKCGAVRADASLSNGAVFCPDCHEEMVCKGELDWNHMTLADQREQEKQWRQEAGMDNPVAVCPVCGRKNESGTYKCTCGYDYKTNEIKKRDITAVARKKSNWPIFIAVAILCIVLKVAVGFYGALDVIILGIVFDIVFVNVYKNKIMNRSGCKVVGDDPVKKTE
jgi:hypothetical protein